MKYFWLFLFHSTVVAVLMYIFTTIASLWSGGAELGLSIAFGAGSGLGQVTLAIIKDRADEMLWHRLWMIYHLPRSVRYMDTNSTGKISFGEHEAYHKHHFARYWHHSKEYQKLNPEGMKRLADRAGKKICGEA